MRTGLMLDIARRFFSVDEIKRYIDHLAGGDESFLQLHLTDNENVAVECRLLGQRHEDAYVRGTVYYNNVTSKPFLTYAQIYSLHSYANERGVELIPEIDLPAHMGGFFHLADIKGMKDLPRDAVHQGQADILNDAVVDLIFALLKEYSYLFQFARHFHIGYDEYSRVTGERKISFLNRVIRSIIEAGFIPQIWNDTLTVDNMGKIDKRVEIIYWKKVSDGYSTVAELLNEGFRVIIANIELFYFMPQNNQNQIAERRERIRTILSSWQADGLDTLDGVNGVMVCAWMEEYLDIDSHTLLTTTTLMYDAVRLKLLEM